MKRPFVNYYGVLEISPAATPLEVKKAYRKMAFQNHPDVKASGDARRFMLIKKAHDVLADPDKRAAFDKDVQERKLQAELAEKALHNRANHDLSFVTGYVKKNKPWESRLGETPSMKITIRSSQCPSCSGYGVMLDRFGAQKTCMQCGGAGRRRG